MVGLKTILGSDKVVDAPGLNKLGLQVGRTVLASTRVKVARWSTPPELTEAIASLRSEGYAELPELFTAEEVDEIAEVAARVGASPDVPHFSYFHGANRLDGTWRTDVPDADRAVLDRFFLHPTVAAAFAAAERLEVEPGGGRCTIQRLVQGEGDPDREATLHSDTFHPTHKMWLYLTDVTEADGPLVFYPRSQRLSPRQLRGVYQGSVSGTRASRAISEDEIADRKLEPKVFTCKKGTVVMANTFGYHGRIQGSPPGDRLVLHIEVRPHPFRRPHSIGVDRSHAQPTAD